MSSAKKLPDQATVIDSLIIKSVRQYVPAIHETKLLSEASLGGKLELMVIMISSNCEGKVLCSYHDE